MRRVLVILGALAAIAVTVILANVVAFVRLQSRNMRMAGDHVPEVLAVTRDDRRFDEVTFEPYTNGNGCLGVFGTVASEADLTELKRRVEGTNPPVSVDWHVYVASVTRPATSAASAPSAGRR